MVPLLERVPIVRRKISSFRTAWNSVCCCCLQNLCKWGAVNLYSLSAPPLFRRRAITYLSQANISDVGTLVFPGRERTKLRVSLRRRSHTGELISSHSGATELPKVALHKQITCAQRELVEQEIFDELIKEASYLPTMSARVSERQIAVEAAQGVELHFDLVPPPPLVAVPPPPPISYACFRLTAVSWTLGHRR